MIFNTIAAIATSQTIAAIAVIRVSGSEAFTICNNIFKHHRKNNFNISDAQSHKSYFGNIIDGNEIVDEVLITIFKNPHSFTGEDTVEISCHGSVFIQQKILQLLIENGAQTAKAGEFTQRSFLNSKMDLSQAEAVADLISSQSAASHKIAINQLRGGISNELSALREKLINFASLIELELDFSEEDVEFANRDDLKDLVTSINAKVTSLLKSFSLGNSIKNGVPVVIAGKPNVGKSTLLNALLNDEKAIVSEIAGTTRDAIEDTFVIEGILFRLIDTAGIRSTTDVVESIGIERTFEKIHTAQIVLHLLDATNFEEKEIEIILNDERYQRKQLYIIINKIDTAELEKTFEIYSIKYTNIICISAKEKRHIELLNKKLLDAAGADELSSNQTIITNSRHFEALLNTQNDLNSVLNGLQNNITGDFLAMDIRRALQHLGSITGEISSDDLLSNIFSKFCIGK
jgi:tRNA modification GTPase